MKYETEVARDTAFSERYATLIRVSQATGSHRDPRELFEALAKELSQVVSFDYIGVSLQAANSFNLQDHFISVGSAAALLNEKMESKDRLTSWVFMNQKPLVTSTNDSDERFERAHGVLRKYDIRSTCTLPLTTAHRKLGAISFGSKQSNAYSCEDLRFAVMVADQIALAFDNALNFTDLQKAHDELQTKNGRLQVLLELTNRLVSDLELPEMLRTIAASVRRALRCDTVGVALAHPDERQLRLQTLDFPESRGFVHEGMILGPESDAGTVYRTAKRLLVEGAKLPEAVRPNFWVKENLSCGCLLPLISRTRTVGVLGVGRRSEEAFSQDELDFLAQIASQIALAVESAIAYCRVKDQKEQLSNENDYLEGELRAGMNLTQIVGSSSALRRVLKRVQTVASTDSTVLICGETGTGKELVARAIHDGSLRSSKPFVKLNCAAIPTGLLESELFGHEKGAFTGAIARRVGRFEVADGGTIFLDEIGEIPIELQTKLLRVLQEGEFERLGSSRTMRSDARLIAATNRDLEAMLDKNEFRPDLYFRLNVFPIRVPALRERRDDIPLLAAHFVQVFSRRMNKVIDSIPERAMDALSRYDWPGNIRELQNVIERAVILTNGAALRLDIADLKRQKPNRAFPQAASTRMGGTSIRDVLRETEREHILRALTVCNWVVAGPRGAAAHLGMKRSTLQLKMNKLDISRPLR